MTHGVAGILVAVHGVKSVQVVPFCWKAIAQTSYKMMYTPSVHHEVSLFHVLSTQHCSACCLQNTSYFPTWCHIRWFSLLLKRANVCYSNRTKKNAVCKSSSSFHRLHSFSRSQKGDPKSAVFTERSDSAFLQLQKKHLLPQITPEQTAVKTISVILLLSSYLRVNSHFMNMLITR